MNSPRNLNIFKTQIIGQVGYKKAKKVRQSQPNFVRQPQIDFSHNRSKEQVYDKKMKLQRKPRMSQAITSMINLQIHSPQHFINGQASRQCFHSPGYTKKSTLMSKSPSSAYFDVQSLSKTQTIKPQTNVKKHPIQSHKTLNKIEQMLLNHGFELKSAKKQQKVQEDPTKKIKKYPKISQENVLKNQQQITAKKQNQCFKSGFVISEEEQDQNFNQDKYLKETVSTHSSVKNSRQFKITDFHIGKQLGRGKFGTVKIARHKKTGMFFSMKIIKKLVIKKQNLVQQLIKQIKIQSFLNQANIIKLYSYFDDHQNIYLLLQMCPEGNLYHYMQKKRKIQESQAKSLLKSICQGVQELHLNNIIHRDLKPQNIVLCYGMAKICDFGWSTQYRDVMRQTFCGTPLYVSPQLLSGNSYDEKVDLWAIGILGYEMMTGKIPFQIKTEKDLYKIVNNKIVFPTSLSPEAVSFLQLLLVKDPTGRKGIEQILSHPFLSKK